MTNIIDQNKAPPAFLIYDVTLLHDEPRGIVMLTANEKGQAAVNALFDGRPQPWFRDETEMQGMPPDLRCVGIRGFNTTAAFEKLLGDLMGKGCRVGVGNKDGSVSPVVIDGD